MMAVMLLTLPGTPFLYQGEELGMIDADIPDDRVVDPGRRDGCRSPIPWTGDDLHGWYAPTWLPFGAEAPERNVAALRGDPDSILQLYHDVLHLRRHADDLVDGSFELVELEPADTVLAYRRGERWWVVLNLGDEPVELPETVEVAVATVAAMAGARIDAIPARTAVIARR
jgi:alpha-glucosidase